MISRIVFGLSTLIFLSISTEIRSQEVHPGGVSGVKAWYVAMPLPDGKIVLQNKTASTTNLGSWSANRWINFNPAIHFSIGDAAYNVPLGDVDLSQATIFTVHQPEDSIGEKNIWTLTKNAVPNLSLSTHNLEDWSAGTLINTHTYRRDYPAINTYLQYKKQDNIGPTSQYIQLGGRSEHSNRPLHNFSGKIAELIIFNRVLTGEQKQRVESYLALKYGIPLSQEFEPTSYLNASGDVIWDAKKMKDFANNPTGLGRDKGSGLYQKQSSCNYTPNLLAIGLGDNIRLDNSANQAEIPDNTFLIWSDNGNDLEISTHTQGQPTHLLRQWKMSVAGSVADMPTEIQFDAKQAENQPSSAETWWLSIDGSGTGQFPVQQTAYYKVDSFATEGKVCFKNVRWDADRNGADLFTFSIGPKMMGKMSITPPECASAVTGTLHIGAEGGRPPYQFTLTGQNFIRKWATHDNSISDIAGIAPGAYQLSLKDADNTLFQEPFFVQSKDAPVSDLANRYELKNGQPLRLDASTEQPVATTYQWEGPEDFVAYSPAIQVLIPGNYALTMEQDGCKSRQEIEVVQFETDNIKQLTLQPNPVAANAPFRLMIRLHRSGPVQASISTLSGAVLQEQNFYGNNFYQWSETARFPPGVYILTVKSEQSIESLRLIVD